MEFFGHVHSAVWVASGLIMLGRITDNSFYLQKGKAIYDYVRSMTSSFGWLPEYVKWKPMAEENCETCCIKDMIECSHELILAGYPEYWNDLNSFVRNQLVENQVTHSGYVVTDDTKEDKDGVTYKKIHKRMIGGFSGGSLPNSISLTRFRSIAGCCAGFAPIGLWRAWKVSVEETDCRVTVNIPLNKDVTKASVRSFYPNEGRIEVVAKEDIMVAFRWYSWMGDMDALRIMVNGKEENYIVEDGLLIVSARRSDTIILEHTIETVLIPEIVRGEEYKVLWRGPDVVDIFPHGGHQRIYQRDLNVPYEEPAPEEIHYVAIEYGPSQQKYGTQNPKKP